MAERTADPVSSSSDIPRRSLSRLREDLRTGQLSPQEVSAAARAVVAERDPELHAFLEIFPVEEPESGPYAGIPLALKDNMLVEGRKVSAGSKMLENYTAPYDATAIRKLRQAGFTFLGRTNMDEFAMGSSTENSAYGPTANPLAPAFVPGGSSGGSAAAVAMGAVPAALGSDTGGSVRQPASFCGLVGLKPTYGAVSRHGLIAMGSSLDQISPLTRTVADSEIMFDLLRGQDPMDSTTLPDDAYAQTDSDPVQSIGVPWPVIEREGVAEEVVANIRQSAQRLEELGYRVKDIELPHLAYSLAAYYVVMPAEVSANLARFDGVRYGLSVEGESVDDSYQKTRLAGFGDEPRRRIMLGTHMLKSGYYDAYYRRARAIRSLVRRELDQALSAVDVILLPTTPIPPFKLGEKSSDPLAMYMADMFTVPANIAGHPALSVPSGTVRSAEGIDLPLGAQFIAPATEEKRLFEVGRRFLDES